MKIKCQHGYRGIPEIVIVSQNGYAINEYIVNPLDHSDNSKLEEIYKDLDAALEFVKEIMDKRK